MLWMPSSARAAPAPFSAPWHAPPRSTGAPCRQPPPLPPSLPPPPPHNPPSLHRAAHAHTHTHVWLMGSLSTHLVGGHVAHGVLGIQGRQAALQRYHRRRRVVTQGRQHLRPQAPRGVVACARVSRRVACEKASSSCSSSVFPACLPILEAAFSPPELQRQTFTFETFPPALTDSVHARHLPLVVRRRPRVAVPRRREPRQQLRPLRLRQQPVQHSRVRRVAPVVACSGSGASGWEVTRDYVVGLRRGVASWGCVVGLRRGVSS